MTTVAGHRRDARRVRRPRSDRAQQSEIARQFLEDSKPDVILGGGEDFWYPAGRRPGGWPDNPADGPDRGRARATAGTSSSAPSRSATTTSATRERPARRPQGRKLLGLFADEEMFEHREEGHGDLYEPAVPLPRWRRRRSTLSRDKDGFFVLIEEEAIDEMAHENNAGLMIKSGAAIDTTVSDGGRLRAPPPGHADRGAGRPRDRRPDDREPRQRPTSPATAVRARTARSRSRARA